MTISVLHLKINSAILKTFLTISLVLSSFFSTRNGIFDYFNFFSALETAFLTIYKYLKYKKYFFHFSALEETFLTI